MTALTVDDLHAEARKRFGPDPASWAFVCPQCGDVATGGDFLVALESNPRTRDGRPVTAADLVGQECIGRTREGRGCDWTAYGLIPGPVAVAFPGGRVVHSFELAEPAERLDGGGS